MSKRLKSLADAPGTSREYETVYILRPGCTNDEVASINDKVRAIIEDLDGKVLKVDNWGKRRLAYEVSKERKGIYLYWQYLAGASVVDEFERNMRMMDTVLRYMTVKLDSDIVADARPTEVDDETYEKAATTAVDEEDRYMGGPDSAESEEAADGDTVEAASETSEAKTAATAAEEAPAADEAPSADEAKSADEKAPAADEPAADKKGDE